MRYFVGNVRKVYLSYLKLIFVLSLLCLMVPAHALSSYTYLLFQTNSGSLESSLVSMSGSYDRQNYKKTGVSVFINNALTSTYNVGVGEFWTWKWYQVEDAKGNAVNKLMNSLTVTYNGKVGTCDYQWSNDRGDVFCGTFNRWWSYVNSQCWPDGKYKIEVEHDAIVIGRHNFQPTLFIPETPVITVTSNLISPAISASVDSRASSNSSLPAVQAGETDVTVKVTDNLNCGELLEGVTVTLTNTIVPDSASHKHFTSMTEAGTGEYISSVPVWTSINPDKNSIDVDTDVNGEVTATYKAGFYGVQETITAEVTDPTDGSVLSAEDTLAIKKNLVPLDTSGLLYSLRGSFGTSSSCNDQAHNDSATLRRSHYVTPIMRTRVLEMYDRFFIETGIRLSFNDASLQFGGIFDSGTGGRTDVRSNRCHLTHRQGVDIDVNVGGSAGCPDAYNLNCLANTTLGLGAKMKRREILNDIVENDMNGHRWREGSLHYRFIGAVN